MEEVKLKFEKGLFVFPAEKLLPGGIQALKSGKSLQNCRTFYYEVFPSTYQELLLEFEKKYFL